MITIVPIVRNSVVAIMKLHLARPEKVKKGKVRPASYAASVVGSGFCVVPDRYIATAHHIFNAGKTRDPTDKFYAFVVPQNGPTAHHFPVVGFPLEKPELDFAVLELGPCATMGISLPGIPVTFADQPDGTRVVTTGFPAPEIEKLGLDKDGNFLGGKFFLKSHANEGIVAARYVIDQGVVYELNVGWHHGESGGPVVTMTDPPAVFSIMQHYRNIKSPHGVVAGPHRGCALATVEAGLRNLGVTVIEEAV